jgi:hypothetical protein
MLSPSRSSPYSACTDAADLYVIGSVTDVLTGTPPSRLEGLSMKGILAGFQAGSPRDVESIGEFVGFNGVAYARSTGPGADYNALVYGDRLVSNGAVFLRDGAAKYATVEVARPSTFAALYEQFEQRVGGPVCFVGTAVFDTYHVTAIGHAPIHREHIFENHERYYPRPDRRMAGSVPAAIMGCAAALSEVNDSRCAELQMVLYVNPGELAARITAHTHALELRQPVSGLAGVRPALAVNVDHMFHDSVVRAGSFDLYRIRRIVPFCDGECG